MTATISNKSTENILTVFLGWVFLAETDLCPTSVQTKRQEKVRVRPGDTLALNIEGHDGPASKRFGYCVAVTDIEIAP
jgi:hypothetical protein